MTDDDGKSGYREVLKDDDESLVIFLRELSRFERCFCDMMVGGYDFTLKLEIHGNRGQLIHCRVIPDSFARPKGVEGRIKKLKAEGGR